MVVERIIPAHCAADERTLTEHMERYTLAASLLRPDDVVLDVACGVGYGTAMLAAQCRYVYGYDNAPEAIAYATTHYTGDTSQFTQLDLDDTPVRACDVVVSFETLEHLQQPQRFLDHAKRAAGRLIILSTPIVPTQEVNPSHLHDFDRAQVEDWMRPWQPAYFCIQAGEGNVPNGIWVFQHAEAGSTPDDQQLLALNVQHQQEQMWQQYAFIERQQAWVHELERGNTWLGDERTKWQQQAEELVQRLRAQEAWSQELEHGKAWLEAQRVSWQCVAATQEQRLAEHVQRQAQLEQLCHDWQQKSQVQQRALDALHASRLFRLLARLRILPTVSSHTAP